MMRLSWHGNASKSKTTEILMLRYDIECWAASHRFSGGGRVLTGWPVGPAPSVRVPPTSVVEL